jgi:hypothetical protein
MDCHASVIAMIATSRHVASSSRLKAAPRNDSSDVAIAMTGLIRHCERSEAIQVLWIATALRASQ